MNILKMFSYTTYILSNKSWYFVIFKTLLWFVCFEGRGDEELGKLQIPKIIPSYNFLYICVNSVFKLNSV